jgi:2-polyprenyl-3-methyl-5-hydroxy-6-metoxy-1,4-benzoquinol methylase
MLAEVHTVLNDSLGQVRVLELPDGRRSISVAPKPGRYLRRVACVTTYPLDLIKEIHATKGIFVCSEIMREEDPRLVESSIRHGVLSYFEPPRFAGKRILDFGCGAGASSLVLARLLPSCEIVGIELEEKLLRLARLRAQYRKRSNVRFMRSPAGDSLPGELGQFDFAIFSAVFEHLLPHERAPLLQKIWSHVKPGGVLFLNQTPYRYSPVDVHTTGLPLINYLPDKLALHAARRFSKNVEPHEDWETLLRRGIRGGTVPEVMGILRRSGTPVLLAPRKELGDRIDLWYATLSRRHGWFKRSLWLSLKTIKAFSGAQLTPTLTLAIRKEA